MTDTTSLHNDVGRPRDDSIDERVMREVIHVFGGRGWSKLSIDRVAYDAGVGKASIYLRWKSKEELVLATLEQLGPKPTDIDTGSLEGDLRAMIDGLMELYRSDEGKVAQRLRMDVDFPPALLEKLTEGRASHVRLWRATIRNVIAKGWLREDTPLGFILNLIHGTIWSYITTSLPVREGETEAARDEQVTSDLISLIVNCYGTR